MKEIISSGEVFFVASEMERRAIRLYERALQVFSDAPVQAQLSDMLQTEKEHLACFLKYLEQSDFSCENTALLSAQSAQIIFSGGLMEAYRENAFDSPKKLFEYAIIQERNAVETYQKYMQMFDPKDARYKAFQTIAIDEKSHQMNLESRLEGI